MDENEEMLTKFNIAMQKYSNSDSLPDKSSDGAGTHTPPQGRYVKDTYIKVDKDVCPRAALEEIKRKLHLRDARMYRCAKYFGPEQEDKFCISPQGQVIPWQEKSAGYSWIGVNTSDTIFAVTMSDPICKRPANVVQLTAYGVLTIAVADMMGGGVDPSSLRPSSCSGPGAVVSVAQCGHKFQDANRAIIFLAKKLRDYSSLSPQEIEQIAICALKCLLGHEFKPNKIDVCGWGNFNGRSGRVTRMNKDRVSQAINSELWI